MTGLKYSAEWMLGKTSTHRQRWWKLFIIGSLSGSNCEKNIYKSESMCEIGMGPIQWSIDLWDFFT